MNRFPRVSTHNVESMLREKSKNKPWEPDYILRDLLDARRMLTERDAEIALKDKQIDIAINAMNLVKDDKAKAVAERDARIAELEAKIERVSKMRQKVAEVIQGSSASKSMHTGRMPSYYYEIADAVILTIVSALSYEVSHEHAV